MKNYHPYVFDNENRRFVGEFEEMYQAEASSGFDSWHQEDKRPLSKQISRIIVERMNFSKILDLGCGKGALTQEWKKVNNKVVGLDISPTAINTATTRFPDIKFVVADISETNFNFKSLIFEHFSCENIDLTICLETLSYIKDWRMTLKSLSQISQYCLVALFIPKNPIGFVPSINELEFAYEENFEIHDSIHIKVINQIILFGKSKHLKNTK